VDSVEGGASVGWLGRTLDDAPHAPAVLRQAAADVLRGPPTTRVRRRRVSCPHGDHTVEAEVLLVEALPLRRALTSVHDLVVRTLDLFQSQAKSREIDLSFDLADVTPPAVVVDREKVAWAISTLVANALRYARAHVDVRVGSDSDKRTLVIGVSDDGPGIPDQEARWLFEHNPATGKSAGLALLMVRDVVAAHRGTVSVKTTRGQGSTFTMRIPR
jgi:signal transduction histidine kinase